MNSFFNVKFFWEVFVTLLVITDPQLLTGEAADPVELERNKVNVAFVSLGTSLLAGPGAIVAAMLFVQRTSGSRGHCERAGVSRPV